MYSTGPWQTVFAVCQCHQGMSAQHRDQHFTIATEPSVERITNAVLCPVKITAKEMDFFQSYSRKLKKNLRGWAPDNLLSQVTNFKIKIEV